MKKTKYSQIIIEFTEIEDVVSTSSDVETEIVPLPNGKSDARYDID